MLENYFPILLFILVGLAVGVVPMLFGWMCGPNRPDAQKLSPYECGFEAFEDARMKFDVRHEGVAKVELPACVRESLEAALVGGQLLRVGPVGTEQLPEHHRRDAHAEAHENEQQDGK